MYNIPTQNEKWDVVLNPIEDHKLIPNNFGIGVDYWFRLKNYRVEFLPEINYAYTKKDVTFQEGALGEIKWQRIGFQFNTNIYLLNIKGDCNCPTFGKQDPLFKKGLYVQISPGIAHLKSELNDQLISSIKSQTVGTVGIGLGLDIGISQYFTITPWIRHGFELGLDWADLALFEVSSESDYKINQNTTTFGLRMGYRYDYKKR